MTSIVSKPSCLQSCVEKFQGGSLASSCVLVCALSPSTSGWNSCAFICDLLGSCVPCPKDPAVLTILCALCIVNLLDLRVRPPGIEWKTGRNPKWEKNWPKNRKWLSARNREKMAQKWRKNRKMTPNPIFSPFLGHFFAISGRGPIFYFFGQFFPIFGLRPVFHSIAGGLTRNTRRSDALS